MHKELCNQIDREFDLLGQRMNWLMMSNAFLFTAYALAIDNFSVKNSITASLGVLVVSIPYLGLVVGMVTLITMGVATHTIKIRKNSRKQVEKELKQKVSVGFDITVPSNGVVHHVGNFSYSFVPSLICSIWIWVIFVSSAP